jgi:hypothetical protein
VSVQRSAKGRYRESQRGNARTAAYVRLQRLHLAEYRELLAEERCLDSGSGRPYQRARTQAWIRLSKLYYLQFHRLLKEEYLRRGLEPPRKPKAKMTPKHAQQTLAGLADRIEAGTSSNRIYPSQELLEACRVAAAILDDVTSGDARHQQTA